MRIWLHEHEIKGLVWLSGSQIFPVSKGLLKAGISWVNRLSEHLTGHRTQLHYICVCPSLWALKSTKAGLGAYHLLQMLSYSQNKPEKPDLFRHVKWSEFRTLFSCTVVYTLCACPGHISPRNQKVWRLFALWYFKHIFCNTVMKIILTGWFLNEWMNLFAK